MSKEGKADVDEGRPKNRGKFAIYTGTALAGVGAAGFIATGVVCPVCVAGACALVGAGIYSRAKLSKA